MDDFLLVIDWFYDLFKSIWSLIASNWLLSVFVLIGVIGLVVDIVNSSRSQ